MTHEILIVDDEEDIRSLVAGLLQDEGYETCEAGDADRALSLVRSRDPSLVLLDIWLRNSRLDGMGILADLKENHPDLPVVMMSGHGTVEMAVQSIKMGAYDFIEKPFQTEQMLQVIARAVEAARLRKEIAELRLRAVSDAEFVGESIAACQLRSILDRAAPTNSRVLISGPAGSGKEVVARMLHNKSTRANGPFIVLNCATLDPQRVEEELLGTERRGKAFPYVGTFERAHLGTLLLDEIAEMPLETQAKFIRILQDKTFQRIGGGERVSADVRVVTTTTRNLTEEIQAGRFLQDLYHRLSVVLISITPLSERRSDIPLLAQHFMDQVAQATGRPPRRFSDDAMAVMQSYKWPGNGRELRNIVERLMILAPEDAEADLRADMLPSEMVDTAEVLGRWDKTTEIMNVPLRQAREMFERQYLQAQMDRFGGIVSKTADFIGMERSALHRKLKTLGLFGSVAIKMRSRQKKRRRG